MSDTGSLNLRWAHALADGLAAAGLRDLALSPGSRSTPLALVFLRHPAIRCHVVLDERSAAFFALGIAKASARPAAVLATSGSAPANWFPAVIEADAGATPLLLLSANRPPELQGWGANQTIDQNHLFGRHVRAFHQPGPPDTGFSPQYLYRLAARAIGESRWPLAGPVHLDLAFREPLLPAAQAAGWPAPAVPEAVRTTPGALPPDPGLVARMAGAMGGRPGAIVCGGADGAGSGAGNGVDGNPAGFADAVTGLARQLDCPIFAEPLSNLRFGGHDRSRLCVRYDAFLRDPSFVAANPPQWVLRFGAFPVTRPLQNWLATAAAQFIVTPDTRWPDPQHNATTILQAGAAEACRALLAVDPAPPPPAPPEWRAAFARAEAEYDAIAASYRHVDGFEGALIPALLDLLPAGHRLFCGNSMAIRDLDTFSGGGAKPLRLFGNRGASGIDGNLSTALGIATEGPCVALVGDLTAQHDLTALAAAKGRDIVIVVLNNGGGGIFEYLPQAALPEFERAWLTPQAIDFAAAAKTFGVAYERATTLGRFTSAFARALEKGGPTLVEISVDRRASVGLHRRYWLGDETAV